MGYFKNELKEVRLTNKDYWVKIALGLTYGEFKQIASVNSEGEINELASADMFLKMGIKEWNLDDDEGNILPITEDNINRLDPADAMLLIEQMGGIVETEEQKKSSSKEHSPASAEVS